MVQMHLQKFKPRQDSPLVLEVGVVVPLETGRGMGRGFSGALGAKSLDYTHMMCTFFLYMYTSILKAWIYLFIQEKGERGRPTDERSRLGPQPG